MSSKTYENVIRNLREDAPEAARELIEFIRVEEGKVKLDAIKFHLTYISTKEAQQVPEKQLTEYPRDIQIDILRGELKKLEEAKLEELAAIPVTETVADGR